MDFIHFLKKSGVVVVVAKKKKKKKKKHGRDHVHLYKSEQKGFRPGGILSVYPSQSAILVRQNFTFLQGNGRKYITLEESISYVTVEPYQTIIIEI